MDLISAILLGVSLLLDLGVPSVPPKSPPITRPAPTVDQMEEYQAK